MHGGSFPSGRVAVYPVITPPPSISSSVCWTSHSQWQPRSGQRTLSEQSLSLSDNMEWTLLKEVLLLSHCLKVCVRVCETEADKLQLSWMTNEEFKTAALIHSGEIKRVLNVQAYVEMQTSVNWQSVWLTCSLSLSVVYIHVCYLRPFY